MNLKSEGWLYFILSLLMGYIMVYAYFTDEMPLLILSSMGAVISLCSMDHIRIIQKLEELK